MTLSESITPNLVGDDTAKQRREALLRDLLHRFEQDGGDAVQALLTERIEGLAIPFRDALKVLENLL